MVACLDVGQGHEVLGDVNNKLVQKSWSNVETILHVVKVVPKLRSTEDDDDDDIKKRMKQ